MAVFAGAGLMFIIEPMVAKMLLPMFGGSPNVWTTCVLFFQILLLIGYLYAHLLGTRLSARFQIAIHIPIVWLAAFLLPSRIPGGVAVYDTPTLSLIAILGALVGAPFFVISTTAPLLSKWCAATKAINPYLLYAASNAGGLIGLLSYPFLIESSMRLTDQTALAQCVYIIYAVLVTACAVAFYKVGKDLIVSQSSDLGVSLSEAAPTAGSYLRWLVLTVTPQSLVLGLTTYITSELSAIPFFWVVPLFIYLLSFVIAFSPGSARLLNFSSASALLLTLASLVVITDGSYLGGYSSISAFIILHLACLFFVCCACHMRVASLRPSTRHLTNYYLAISSGGVFGSCINTFIAPALFKDYLEYPLMLVVAAVVLTGGTLPKTILQRTQVSVDVKIWLVPLVVLGVSTVSWWHASNTLDALGDPENMSASAFPVVVVAAVAFQFFVPLIACLLLAESARQLKLGIALVGIFALLDYAAVPDFVVFQKRNFFGCLTIAARQDENVCEFFHGHTLHGSESLDPDERGKPISYYYPTSPIGSILTAMYGPPQTLRELAADVQNRMVPDSSDDPLVSRRIRMQRSREVKPAPIAVIGLGAGTIASYAKRGQPVVYYEIDREVVDIASNPIFFTYIFQARARGVDLKVLNGDGRLEIQKAPYNHFQAIFVDAFTGDAIPTHLLTREALATYRSKLTRDGMIVFNISNHYYDLRPVLETLAAESELAAYAFDDSNVALERHRTNASWVILTSDQNLQRALRERGWEPLHVEKKVRPWTDDFCSPLTVLSHQFL